MWRVISVVSPGRVGLPVMFFLCLFVVSLFSLLNLKRAKNDLEKKKKQGLTVY
jgi:hypothetical protein